MNNSITTGYTGADATGEIVVMLAVAFALGYLLRLAWEKFMFTDIYEEYILDEPQAQPVVQNNVAPAAPVAAASVAPTPMPAPMPYKQDDLKIVEGIGPKIEQLLHEGGIKTWQELANTPAEQIKTILNAAGERYRIHDPSTWPEQSRLAAEGKWHELEEFQNFLSGGKVLG